MPKGWDCLWTASTSRPFVHPPDDRPTYMSMVEWYWQVNPMNSEKSCLSVTFSTTNPHGLTRAGTQASAVRGRPLTGWTRIITLIELCVYQISVATHNFRSGASVASTSQVRVPAMLLLPIVGHYEIRVWGDHQWHNVHSKFNKNPAICCRF